MAPCRPPRGSRGAPPCAFSLVETLVVALIVAILAGLLAVHVRGIRGGARDVKSIANLRTHSSVLHMYANDFASNSPSITYPLATFSVVRCASQGLAVAVRYFEASWAWNVALADSYYAGDPASPVFRVPRSGAVADPFANEYHISCTFFAAPGYWDGTSRTTPPAQFQPAKLTDVAFPSLKGHVLTTEPWFGITDPRPAGRYTHAAFADGHAKAVLASQMNDEMPQGDGPPVLVYGTHSGSFAPFFHTFQGVRGRDFRP